MAERNPFEAAAIRSADRAVRMDEEAEESNAVPFGMRRVPVEQFRRILHDPNTVSSKRAEMLESLGETRKERLAAYFKRITPRRKPVFGE